MSLFISQLINGLVLSGPILLIAISLSVTLSACGVLNLAVGGAYSLIAIIAVRYLADLGTVGFFVLCLGGPIVLAMVMELVALAPQRKRAGDPTMAAFAATMGFALIFTALASEAGGSSVFALPTTFIRISGDWAIGGVRIPHADALVFGVAAVLAVILGLILYRTNLGLRYRAISADSFLAQTSGIRVNNVIRGAWIGGSLMLGVGIILTLMTDRAVSPLSGGSLLLIPLAAVVAGGLGNPVGAAVMSIFFGVSTALMTLVTSNGDLQQVLVFGVLFAILLVRPEGIFGGALGARSY